MRGNGPPKIPVRPIALCRATCQWPGSLRRLLLDAPGPVQRPSITLHIHHKLSCPVLPPCPLRALTSIQFSTLLSKHTTRKPVKTSPLTLWRPSFNHAIPPTRYSPLFEDKYLRSINQKIAMKGSQNALSQLSTSCTRFLPLLARVLVS